MYQLFTELGGDSVAESAVAERLAWLGIARLGVTGLNHEVLYDTVEKQPVIGALFDQFQEIVAVQRGLVIKTEGDFTLCGGHLDHSAFTHVYFLISSYLRRQ